MTSDKKVESNRRNASQSTGPRTPEGKRIASQNASKLGIFSRELLLRGEDEAELHMFARALRADLQPCGPMEMSLAEIIIGALWRLRRLLRIETGLIEMYRTYKGVDGGPPVAFAHDASQLDCFARVGRAETNLEKRLYRAIHELKCLQQTRRGQPTTPPIDVETTQTPGVLSEQSPRWRRWIGR
jgi:hypothetical protein